MTFQLFVLNRLISGNRTETMVLSSSTSAYEQTTLGEEAKPQENTFNEKEDKRSLGKKVRFSQPLEYWREFDSTTIAPVPEIKSKIHLPKPKEVTSVKSTSSHWELNSNLAKGNVKRTRGVRSITDAVQAFQTDDEKNSVRKFIAHYKRTTVRHVPETVISSRQSVHNVIVREFEKIPNVNSISDGKKENKEHLCKVCSTVAQSDASSLYNRPYKLPSINYQSRKTFDERLLPFTGHSQNCVEYSRYLRTGCRTQSTPLIVQLFE